MRGNLSPIFQTFELQHHDAKVLFLALGKQIKSRKAIELSAKMDFLELYSDLMARVHFSDERLKSDLFSEFKPLQKSLKKIHHFKLVENNLKIREQKTGLAYNSYRSDLEKYKKKLYTDTFDLIVSSTIKTWDDFFVKNQELSKGIKALAINTAINQIIQDELEFFQLDQKGPMDSKALKDTFEGLRIIIMLENLRMHVGFNPIFISGIHEEIETLKDSLKPWYSNQLSLQSLGHFLAEKEDASKKYLDWMSELRNQKKSLSSLSEKQAKMLFSKILN